MPMPVSMPVPAPAPELMPVPVNLRVWEVLSDFNNISEQQARRICNDFMEVDVDLPPDGLACDYTETIQDVCESMEAPDIRQAMLSGNDDIQLSADTEDPFYCSIKIATNELDKYLIHHKGNYRCDICCNMDLANGVQLSCSQANKPCQSVFCKDCISQWVTKCVSRCPTCRGFCSEIRDHPVTIKPRTLSRPVKLRKKIIVTIRQRNGTHA